MEMKIDGIDLVQYVLHQYKIFVSNDFAGYILWNYTPWGMEHNPGSIMGHVHSLVMGEQGESHD